MKPWKEFRTTVAVFASGEKYLSKRCLFFCYFSLDKQRKVKNTMSSNITQIDARKFTSSRKLEIKGVKKSKNKV